MEISKDVISFLIKNNIKNKKLIEDNFKYQIFKIYPNSREYEGFETVSAKDIEEVKRILESYKSLDVDNKKDTDIFGKIVPTNIYTDVWNEEYSDIEDFAENYYNGIRYVG